MAITIFSVAGCLRCNIVKQFLKDSYQSYQDYDALGEGRETFRTFYQNNRPKIHRGPDGVEFPIISDGAIIRQGLPMIVAHLVAGPSLNGFFKPGSLHGQWVDGIHVSDGDPAHGEQFLEVLAFLKNKMLKVEIETNGVNARLLQQVLERGLADRAIMEVKGPLELYDALLQRSVDPEEIKRSIALMPQCDEYYFYTTITPVIREPGDPGQISYISPEEIAEAANLIKVAAGDNRQPYRLRTFDPHAADDPRVQEYKPLATNQLFKYRTMARKHQFKTELISIRG